MNSIEQIKKASKMVIYTDPMIIKKYFALVSKTIGSTKIVEICDEIVKNFEVAKKGQNEYYGLDTFINMDIAKKLDI